jgi:hypothetical protein
MSVQKEIEKLDIGESFTLEGKEYNNIFLRVPGGWIVTHTDSYKYASSVFVSFPASGW